MTPPTMLHRLAAEFVGTFWLVLGGCGSAVFAAKFASSDGVSLGIGFLGVALAFGLTVLTGVYAFGTISGGHFNPAVTLGAALARRVEWKALPGYWVVQVLGGLVGGVVILVVAKGRDGSRRPETWPPTATAHTRRAVTRCWPSRSPRSSSPGCSYSSSLARPTTARLRQKVSRACRSA